MPEISTRGYDVAWHVGRMEMREKSRLQTVSRLVSLVERMAEERRMWSIVEQRLISALYLPTIAETTVALAEIIASLLPE